MHPWTKFKKIYLNSMAHFTCSANRFGHNEIQAAVITHSHTWVWPSYFQQNPATLSVAYTRALHSCKSGCSDFDRKEKKRKERTLSLGWSLTLLSRPLHSSLLLVGQARGTWLPSPHIYMLTWWVRSTNTPLSHNSEETIQCECPVFH